MRNALKVMIFTLALVCAPDAAWALNCTANPYTLTNNSTADANQVMSNFNNLLNCANNNLAHNGANSDITSLSALSTPLSVAQGGTGATTSTGTGSVVLQNAPTLTATLTGAAASFSGAVTAANANTISGTLSLTNGQTSTMFTVASAGAGGGTAGIGYLVFAGAGGPSLNYAIVGCSGAACAILASTSNTVSFSVSGSTNIQVTNTNGGGNTVTWTALRIS